MSDPAPPSPTNAFGPDSPCDLDTCPIEWSIYQYQPDLAANACLLVVFAGIGTIHGYLGFRWKSWGFMVGMLLGCVSEIIGYAGRLMLHGDPFSFEAFMIQTVCLTIAPVFFTASIYVTLSKTVIFFAPDLSRFKPQLFYWIFIPADIVCLILQAAGGAISTEDSENANNPGVDISMAGLVLQIIVIVAFVACFADYMFRLWRSSSIPSLDWRLTAFLLGLSTAIILILIRCAYRVAELKDGYAGEMITHEIPFIILEGVAVALAAIALLWGHPGLVLDEQKHRANLDAEKGLFSSRNRNLAP